MSKETFKWTPDRYYKKIGFRGIHLRMVWRNPEKRAEFLKRHAEGAKKRAGRKLGKSKRTPEEFRKSLDKWLETKGRRYYESAKKIGLMNKSPEVRQKLSESAKRYHQSRCPFAMVSGEVEVVEIREQYNTHSGVVLESDLGAING